MNVLVSRILLKTLTALTTCMIFYFVEVDTWAQNSETEIDQKVENMAVEYASCSAYFIIIAQALETSDKKSAAASAKQYAMFAYRAFEISNNLAGTSRNKSFAETVTKARVNSYAKEMMKTIQHRYENIAILYDKHLDTCEVAMNKFSDNKVFEP